MHPFMISYAQNFEDVMLMRALGHIENGRYIDIGANDPVHDSVSLAFYQRGWRGVHVEPIAEFADRLTEARPDETVIRAIISNDTGPMLFYNVVETGMSTGDPAIAAQHLKAGFQISTQLTECMTLATLLDDFCQGEIHWMKIDVEGMEQGVLESWAGSEVRPWIVVIESTKPNSTETTHDQWENIIISLGYRFSYFDGLNRFYIHFKHDYLERVFEIPPNYFDNFSVTKRSIFARDPQTEIISTQVALEAARSADAEHTRELEARLSAAIAESERRLGESVQLRDQISTLSEEMSAASHRFRGEIAGLQRELLELRTSVWWRGTGPIRWLTRRTRRLLLLVWTWLCFRPGTRPYRVSRGIRNHLRAAFKLVGALTRKWLARLRLLPRTLANRSPKRGGSVGSGPINYVFVGHTVTCTTNSGVQRVVRGLSDALLRSGQPVRFVKWLEERNEPGLITLEERKYLGMWNGPSLLPGEAGLYRSKSSSPISSDDLAAWGGRLICPEVTSLIATATPVTAPLIAWAKTAGLRAEFIYYDGIPLRRPEFHEFAPVHAQYMRDLRMADEIWPISRWSGDEIASFWGANRELDNTHLPVIRPIHLPAEFDRVRQTRFQIGEKMILSVGTIEQRKNQLALVHAFIELLENEPDSGWRLCLVGNLHPAVAVEFNAAIDRIPQIEFKGHVSDAELSALYERCAFTVFPSLAEGFGLPILESLWHAKPCLTANFGAMGEVAAGGGCLTTDTRDRNALKENLHRLMTNPALVESLARQAIARPMSSWGDYLAEIDKGAGAQSPLIYYWVNSTVTFPNNTGIQRVARQLARELLAAGFRLVPVKWGGAKHPMISPTAENLDFFARWNGPQAQSWHPWVSPGRAGERGLFIMTELPLELAPSEQIILRTECNSLKLEMTSIFYDTIPWKMRDIYDAHFSEAHRSYMVELRNYSKILAISQYSCDALKQFYVDSGFVLEDAGCTIQTVSLPAEFPEQIESEFAGSPPNLGTQRPICILCVGSVEPRKNHLKMVHAFIRASKTSSQPLALIIAGRETYSDLANELTGLCTANPAIIWDKEADDAKLRAYYEAADFTIYPSVEEGFGLPILESLWYGKPTICANFGAMQEVAAEGGGCLTVDVTSEEALAAAILELATNSEKRKLLGEAARKRRFKSWKEYASEVAGILGLWNFPDRETSAFHREELGLGRRPRLSVCISTYNRAHWLAVSLRNISQLYPNPIDGVEFVICDNASADDTPDIVMPYLGRPDFHYQRNPINVGMLGNLRETTKAANGDYVWILGDDDLLMPGAIENVLSAIEANPGVALVYLNYAYTRLEDARTITDFTQFFAEATPIVAPEPDLTGPIRKICARNENFFTAIYTLVFRRDHALGAYSQDTSGRPFSTMLTCIPTTHYVLNNMMHEPGVWLGTPQLVVNLNVSWMRYAPLWILERIPEVYQTALERGVPLDDINRWRRHTMPGVVHYLQEIYKDDPLGNAEFFSMERLIGRFSGLPQFAEFEPQLLEIYRKAHEAGNRAALVSPEQIFPSLMGGKS